MCSVPCWTRVDVSVSQNMLVAAMSIVQVTSRYDARTCFLGIRRYRLQLLIVYSGKICCQRRELMWVTQFRRECPCSLATQCIAHRLALGCRIHGEIPRGSE